MKRATSGRIEMEHDFQPSARGGEGHSLGYGYNRAPDSPIKLPKGNGGTGYGKKTKSVRVHGGDQYGVTLCKSEPAVDFPKTPVSEAPGTVVEKRGY